MSTMRLLALLVGLTVLGMAFLWRDSRVPLPGRLVVAPTYFLVDGSRPGENGQRVFRLTNHSQQPVTIREIDHCPGCNQINDLRGRILQPSESCELSVRVEISKAGLDAQHLAVWHSHSQEPLRLTLDVFGRQTPPYIVKQQPAKLAFFDLDLPEAVEELRITTCERTDSDPWLKSLACEIPEVRIESVGFREEPYDSSTVRHYSYRIGWRQLPRSPEFHGKLFVTSAGGGKGEQQEINEVLGTRSRQRNFSPAVARLTAARGWQDSVVFRARTPSIPWRIAPDWSKPAWLEVAWDQDQETRILRLAARHSLAPSAATRISIPLTAGEGHTEQLPVELCVPTPVPPRP